MQNLKESLFVCYPSDPFSLASSFFPDDIFPTSLLGIFHTATYFKIFLKLCKELKTYCIAGRVMLLLF